MPLLAASIACQARNRSRGRPGFNPADRRPSAVRWFAAAAGAALLLSCMTLQPSLAGSPSTLVAEVAPGQGDTEVPVWELPKWLRIQEWLTAGNVAADPAVAEWARWATALRGRPEMERLVEINGRVNRSFRFASDMEVWGVADYWETPAEVIRKGATDCEGFAIFKYWLARLAGIPDDQLFMMVGMLGSIGRMHATLVAGVADRGYVLDQRTPYIVDAANFGDFRLLVTVDLQVIRIFARGIGGNSAGPVAMN